MILSKFILIMYLVRQQASNKEELLLERNNLAQMGRDLVQFSS